MKNLIYTTIFLCITLIVVTGCKKEAATAAEPEISQDVLARIRNLGFSNTGVQKINEGYLVEGDIILTESDMNSTTPVQALRVANTEQYRTKNLVNALLPRTITLAVSDQLPAEYKAAVDEVVSRYNAEGLRLKFLRVSAGIANITFVNATGSYLASAGFPRGGEPYPTVKVNAAVLGTGTSTAFINFAATVLAHEVGHCIGFRHTDYMDRSYSCGGGYSNEGASSAGAIHIEGTPTKAEPNSWMLACIRLGQNRPFDAYDKVALAYLYK